MSAPVHEYGWSEGHSEQELAVEAEYVPLGHGVSELDPASQYWPGEQAV
jgi:hypothetical protein